MRAIIPESLNPECTSIKNDDHVTIAEWGVWIHYQMISGMQVIAAHRLSKHPQHEDEEFGVISEAEFQQGKQKVLRTAA